MNNFFVAAVVGVDSPSQKTKGKKFCEVENWDEFEFIANFPSRNERRKNISISTERKLDQLNKQLWWMNYLTTNKNRWSNEKAE